MQPLNKTTVSKPSYPEKVVQFGAGNFLRAFADWAIDILNEKTDFAAGVVIVKPTPGGSYADLDKQDGLYHVELQSSEAGKLKTETRLIRCISRSLSPYEDFAAFLELAQEPQIRFILSNTTESGISFRAEDKLEDAPPQSFPAKLTHFLFERFRSGLRGCIILPCELIEDNGSVLKTIILKYADLWHLGDAFKHWLDLENTFCNTLVDRIVTGFPADAETRFQEMGFADQQLVRGEAYHSWVIEAPDFVKKEFPTSETAMNVSFTHDLKPYREIKVRILNGAHTAMVPVGYLSGRRTVDEVMRDEGLRTFIQNLLFEEVLPTLEVAREELESFANATLKRFENPSLKHQLSAIALNSSSKFRTRLLPSLLAYTKNQGEVPKRICFAFACLIRFYKASWQGEALPVKDDAEVLEWWQAVWSQGSPEEVVDAVLANETLWGQDLRYVKGLKECLVKDLERLESEKIADTVASLK
ncbi:MAG: tagaturonate reductase [Trueperaceae bacterium]|nr:tagaturonate reductase [Trueperaceae bacterium]